MTVSHSSTFVHIMRGTSIHNLRLSSHTAGCPVPYTQRIFICYHTGYVIIIFVTTYAFMKINVDMYAKLEIQNI